ncbi:MAG: hypothetical protein ACI8QS_003207 [Planctomycetota bacterium]|jgi:hypothetical protein
MASQHEKMENMEWVAQQQTMKQAPSSLRGNRLASSVGSDVGMTAWKEFSVGKDLHAKRSSRKKEPKVRTS